MPGTNTCRNCGQANAADSEYCVRCGERMPDPASTQLVDQPGAGQPEYPWEPPAEWDPGELPPSGGQQQTWVSQPAYTPPPVPPAPPNTPGYPGAPSYPPAANAGNQVGWNTGNDTGAGAPWGGLPGPAPTGSGGGNRKPILIGLGVLLVIAAVVVGVVLATGGKKKSGTTALNGVQNQSGSDALTTARVALRDANTTHLAGTVQSNGQPIRLDLTLVGSNSEGILTVNNNDVQIIKLDQNVFIKGDADFLKQYAGNNTAVLAKLNGKWLKTATTSDFDKFSIDGFADILKGGPGATANSKTTQSTLNGKPVVIVSFSDGSKLTIANTGQPVPLAIDQKGSNGGQVTFSDYNKNVTVAAPPAAEVLDVNSLTTPTPTPTPSPTDTSGTTPADLVGTYDCSFDNGRAAGTLTLEANNSYTVSGGTPGGFWGSSGDQVAFNTGTLDKYAGTYDEADTITLHGAGTNASVTLKCVFQ